MAILQLPPTSLVGSADQGICQPAACLRAHEGLFRCAPQVADTPRGPRDSQGWLLQGRVAWMEFTQADWSVPLGACSAPGAGDG